MAGIQFCPYCSNRLVAPREERRKAIVIFADIAGFTALGESMDPDDLRDLIDQIMKRFVTVIQTQGGLVDKIIGDCVMFLFGTEHATSDDPIHAIEAVENIQHELKIFNQENQLNLSLHVGIAFGTVSVGLVGQNVTVMGDTVNLAQRLEGVAKLDEVLVSDAFVELLGAAYRFERLDPISLKGKRVPVAPYRYIGKASSENKTIPFIGRQEELEQTVKTIQEHFSTPGVGNILVLGSAGMGKTKFIDQICRSLPSEKATRLSVYFEEGGKNYQLPFLTMLKAIFSNQNWKQLEGLILPRMMFSQSSARENMGYEQFEELLLQVLGEIAREQNILLICENIHRADTSSLHLLKSLRKNLKDAHIFVLASSRRSFSESDFPNTLELSPLKKNESRSLFDEITKDDSSTDETCLLAIEKCAGNPLFLTELAKGVKENLPADKLFSGRIDLLLAASLDALPNETQELIKQASIFGSRIPLSHLAKLSGKSPETVLEDLVPLTTFHFVSNKEMFVFRNDLMRETAYERINLQTRRSLHQALAELLVDAKALPEEIAFHFLHSDRHREALRTSLEAGKRLSRLPQQEEALSFLHHAQKLARKLQDIPSLIDAMELHFEVESRNLGTDKARLLLNSYREDPLLQTHGTTHSRFSMMEARFLFRRHLYQEAQDTFKSIENIELDPFNEVERELLKYRILNHFRKRKEVVHQALSFLRRKSLEPSQRGNFYLLIGSNCYMDRELQQAQDFYEKALKAFESVHDERGVLKSLANKGNVAHAQANYSMARECFMDCLQTAIQLGDLVVYNDILYRLGRTNFDLMRFEEAIQNYDQIILALRKSEWGHLYYRVALAKAHALFFLGERDSGRVLLDEAKRYFQEVEDSRSLAITYQVELLDLLENEDPSKSLALSEKILSILADVPDFLPQVHFFRVFALCKLGQKKEAQEYFDTCSANIKHQNTSDELTVAFLLANVALNDPPFSENIASIITFLSARLEQFFVPLDSLLIQTVVENESDKNFETRITNYFSHLSQSIPASYKSTFEQKPSTQRLKKLIPALELPHQN